MEPFGLLNLLKSLLPQAENPERKPNESSDESGRGSDGGANAVKTEKDPVPPPKTEKNPTFAEEPQNAFLDFVNRHDERKKQIKKP